MTRHRFLGATLYALSVLISSLLATADALATTYHVARSATNAADSNSGAEDAPWKTISRAAAAEELVPGDSVLIHSGVYREHVQLKACGEPGKPVTFAAAPGARVVLKGSELVRGKWAKLADDAGRQEPYPRAFADIWKIKLGDEFFVDPRFRGIYDNKSRRWVSQVFVNDNKPLQRIGPDPIYKNKDYLQLATVGRNLDDMIQNSFFFDAAEETLYIKIAGNPSWYSIEVGVRGFVFTAENAHDVVIQGLEFRQNRQPGGQWPMVTISNCERVVLEDCKVSQSDFCGLGLGRSKDCTVRDCDLSYNGCTGLGMSECRDCLVEACTLLSNNYRRFHSGWAAAGMKCIPRNTGCTVRNCEVAYNVACGGIWFDYDNADINILGNVCHHNDGPGVFFEINKDGGVIADNLVYANRDRGIYISGSQNTTVVHNTVACNESGIVAMPRGEDWPLENVQILNNLLICNYATAETVTRGCDLTLHMGCPEYGPYDRTVTSNHSDYNVYANTSWTPTMRHSWNPNNTLGEWQERFGEDLHSTEMPVAFEMKGTGFAFEICKGLEAPEPLSEDVSAVLSPISHAGCRRAGWPESLGRE
jgi:parallel beta-helix repeat protein